MRLISLVPALVLLAACAPVRREAPVDMTWTLQRPGTSPAELTASMNAPSSIFEQTVLETDPHFPVLQHAIRARVWVTLGVRVGAVRHAHIRVEADQMSTIHIVQANGAMDIGGDVFAHLAPGERDVELTDGAVQTLALGDGFNFTIVTLPPASFGPSHPSSGKRGSLDP